VRTVGRARARGRDESLPRRAWLPSAGL
jgi:hypothetical protein